jgi:16S rRNA (adenine1518-N6/adenine1519-N6)-dimethyltransferase
MSEPGDLTAPTTLIPLLQRHGFHTRKGLGQHFLISRKAVEAIVAGCRLDEGLPILEIGPGIGTLTRPLAERGAQVTAVEIDTRAIAVLAETVGAFPNVRVLEADILSLDLAEVLGEARWTVVGNLPYYITTPVIARLLEHAPQIARAVLMVQHEVAERMRATPGGKTYGSLTVFVQTFATVERVIDVPKGAFLPPPTVESMVIRLTLRDTPLVPPALQPVFFQVVRAAFGHRRKTLENALAFGGILNGDRAQIAQAVVAAGLTLGRRAETLSIDDYRTLAEEVAAH